MNADLLAPYDLTGRVALVTGTGSIGRACAKRLAAYGATVAISCVEGVEDPADARRGFGNVAVTAHPLNLRKPDSIRRCIADVADRHGRIDVLVNNAAVVSATVASFSNDPEAQDSLMLAINADGTLKMCQRFLVLPGAPGRKLINISSVGGEVDVFAICPGATNTPMFQGSTLSKLSRKDLTAFLSRLPKERLIEPSEIAALVNFLASPPSRVLHGAVLDASMGLGVRPGLMSELTVH